MVLSLSVKVAPLPPGRSVLAQPSGTFSREWPDGSAYATYCWLSGISPCALFSCGAGPLAAAGAAAGEVVGAGCWAAGAEQAVMANAPAMVTAAARQRVDRICITRATL
ncbi:hypothetical protein GCM10009765_76820 [Fodinicola feengrottensis]|uniref:Uncharacterized protein n=1 Tax=Fodinicola feengrottensis TaxID=435914 RepID=A0ABN2J3I5_9ACTN